MEGAKVQSLKDAFPSFFIASVNVKKLAFSLAISLLCGDFMHCGISGFCCCLSSTFHNCWLITSVFKKKAKQGT